MPTPPKSSDNYTELIKLTESHFFEVKHNMVFVEGYTPPTSPEIPSYNIFVILGALGIVSVSLVWRIRMKKRNHN